MTESESVYRMSYVNPYYGIIYDNKYMYILDHNTRTNIKNIISNLKIELETKDDAMGDIYYGYVKECESLITKRINDKEKYPLQVSFDCNINKSNIDSFGTVDNKYKNECLETIKHNCKEYIKYLKKINMNLLYKQSNKYIIVPCIEVPSVPISIANSLKINRYINNKSYTRLYKYLQQFYFDYHIMDSKIRTIYDMDNNYMKEIKENIKKFVYKILGYDFDDFFINCKITQVKNLYVYARFNINDIIRGIKYTNYYKILLPTIDIDTLINTDIQKVTMVHEIKMNYDSYTKINDNVYKQCSTDPFFSAIVNDNRSIKNVDELRVVDMYHNNRILKEGLYVMINNSLVSTEKNTLYIHFNDNIFKKDMDKKYEQYKLKIIHYDINKDTIKTNINEKYKGLTIINYYVDNNPVSSKISVRAMDKLKNVYIITIHVVTFYALKNHKKLQELMKKSIRKIRKSNDRLRIKKICDDEYDRQLYIVNMPGYFGISIKKIPYINSILNTMFMTETPNIYKNILLPKIKEGLLDIMFIIKTILVQKNIDRIKSYELVDNFVLSDTNDETVNDIIRTYFDGLTMVSKHKNFFITTKKGFSKSYILWYLPKFKILQKDNNDDDPEIKLNKIVEYIKQCYDETNKNYKRIYDCGALLNNNKEIKEYILKNTNYREVFNSDDFIYNLKHLKETHKEEIDDLLFEFLKNIYIQTTEKDMTSTYYNKYHVYCNYPLMTIYSAFHMQIIHPLEIALVDKYNPKNRKYYVDSDKRQFYWNTIKSINMENNNFTIPITINLKQMLSNQAVINYFGYDRVLDEINEIKY